MSACADKTFSLVIHKRNEIMLMHPTVFEQNRPHWFDLIQTIILRSSLPSFRRKQIPHDPL